MFIVGVNAFLNFGLYLVKSDPLPEELDVIMTFADEKERVEYSKKLVKKYEDVIWIWSGVKQNKNNYLANAAKEDFDTTRIVFIDSCNHTSSELNFLKLWLENYQTDSFSHNLKNKKKICIGLISSPYHMRRIQLLAYIFLDKKQTSLYFLPVPLDKSVYTHSFFKSWWKSRYAKNLVLFEYYKMVYAFLFNYIL